jgi:tRNA threonylcarbamoyladenosine biosynthesis protein TsaE
VLVNEYPGRTQLFHVDLYRIQDPVELEDIGLHEILVSNGVTVIEWAERMGQDLPKERLGVAISVVDDHTRNLHLSAYGQHAVYLIEKCEREFLV